MDDKSIDMMFREIRNLKYLDHPNILKIYEYYEDDKFYYIITDVFRGGQLFDELVSRRKVFEPDAA